MKLSEIWKAQREATRKIEAEFGTQNALGYLIGEKLISDRSAGGRTRQGVALGERRLTLDRFLGGSPIIIVFHGCLIDGDCGFRHQVHGLLRREEREPFESHVADDFKDGFLDPLLQLVDGFLIHHHFSKR